MSEIRPSLLVWSSLFPSPAQPQAGIFVRERMFRVGERLPVTVISPQPWFPLQGLVRLVRPHFRPPAPRHETRGGVEIFRPHYFSFPGCLKQLDAFSMALRSLALVRHLAGNGRADIIDAHFGYPDGAAATWVGKRLRIPVTVTLRGTEVRHSREPALRTQLIAALDRASHVFCVSSSLRQLALGLGIDPGKVTVVGNGVDVSRFRPIDPATARAKLGLPSEAKVMITVGGLVERKGFHRVIACMPELQRRFPHLHYLVVGSAGPEGDYSKDIHALVDKLGIADRVHLLGSLPPESVSQALSAADVFVLSSRNEGWANVLLEAMACGLPVVATDVGGNAEVVCRSDLGRIVPFDDHDALQGALIDALGREWDRGDIRRYAEQNDWQFRVDELMDEFGRLASSAVDPAQGAIRAP